MSDDKDILFPSLFPDLTQGARAVRSGNFLKEMIEGAFSAHGVRVVNDHKDLHVDSLLFPRKGSLLIREVGLTKVGKIDFLYKNFSTGLILPIECRNQMSGGTCDEKLTFVIENLVETGCKQFWLVLAGAGWRPEVLRTARRKIASIREHKGVVGSLVQNQGSLLQKAIERLIDKGQTQVDH